MSVKLMHGDCLELMKDIEPGSVNLVLADPPYGITARNPWDKVIPFAPMWDGLHSCVKYLTGGVILLFGLMPFAADLVNSNRKEFRYEWIWQKTNPIGFLNAHKMPLRAHESIYVFYKKLPKYNPQKWQSTPYVKTNIPTGSSNYHSFSPVEPAKSLDGLRYPIDVIKFTNNGGNTRKPTKHHPTEKPVKLLEYLIKTYTDEGDTVLDFCMGSGSTGVAAVNTGRNFIGIELDEHYFKVAGERIGKAQAEREGIT